jgi:hypothetical protein
MLLQRPPERSVAPSIAIPRASHQPRRLRYWHLRLFPHSLIIMAVEVAGMALEAAFMVVAVAGTPVEVAGMGAELI